MTCENRNSLTNGLTQGSRRLMMSAQNPQIRRLYSGESSVSQPPGYPPWAHQSLHGNFCKVHAYSLLADQSFRFLLASMRVSLILTDCIARKIVKLKGQLLYLSHISCLLLDWWSPRLWQKRWKRWASWIRDTRPHGVFSVVSGQEIPLSKLFNRNRCFFHLWSERATVRFDTKMAPWNLNLVLLIAWYHAFQCLSFSVQCSPIKEALL